MALALALAWQLQGTGEYHACSDGHPGHAAPYDHVCFDPPHDKSIPVDMPMGCSQHDGEWAALGIVALASRFAVDIALVLLG